MVGIFLLKLLRLLWISMYSHESGKVLRCRGKNLNIIQINGNKRYYERGLELL